MNIEPFEKFAVTVTPPEDEQIEIPDDVLPVPNDAIGYRIPGEKIFSAIAPAHRFFTRGGVIHEVARGGDGARATLAPLTKERAVSVLEDLALAAGKRIARLEKGKKDGVEYIFWRKTNMPLGSMEILMKGDPARVYLPAIRQLVSCPVIVETKSGGSKILSRGFHDEMGGTFVTHGEPPPVVPLDVASEALMRLHEDFDFCTGSDFARAIAAMLSPALKMGGLIRDDFPIHIAEATESQSGKDFLQKLHSRIYNERPAGIAPTSRGVGSLDETISKALIAGKPFICFSNFRGKLESAILETAIRGQGSVECRALRTSATVDCSSFIWQLSTNGSEFTRDLANRAIITRLRKRPPNYNFQPYPEGDLIAHVEKNQSFYLGCVFAVIAEWVAQGKPRTNDTRHDFRGWTQALDWIGQSFFALPPLLDGHQEQQARTANPALQWLRDVAIAVVASGRDDMAMTAVELVDICEDGDLEIPGRRDSTEEPKFRIGRALGKLFVNAKSTDEHNSFLMVDDIVVSRETFQEYDDEGRLKTRHRYSFAKESKK